MQQMPSSLNYKPNGCHRILRHNQDVGLNIAMSGPPTNHESTGGMPYDAALNIGIRSADVERISGVHSKSSKEDTDVDAVRGFGCTDRRTPSADVHEASV